MILGYHYFRKHPHGKSSANNLTTWRSWTSMAFFLSGTNQDPTLVLSHDSWMFYAVLLGGFHFSSTWELASLYLTFPNLKIQLQVWDSSSRLIKKTPRYNNKKKVDTFKSGSTRKRETRRLHSSLKDFLKDKRAAATHFRIAGEVENWVGNRLEEPLAGGDRHFNILKEIPRSHIYSP